MMMLLLICRSQMPKRKTKTTPQNCIIIFVNCTASRSSVHGKQVVCAWVRLRTMAWAERQSQSRPSKHNEEEEG